MRNEVLQIRPGRICEDFVTEVRVEPDAHEQAGCMWLVPVQLYESIENLAIDETLLLKRFQGPFEVVDHATMSSIIVVIIIGLTSGDEAAAAKIVEDTEDWAHDRKANKVFLVHLLEGKDRIIVAAIDVQVVELGVELAGLGLETILLSCSGFREERAVAVIHAHLKI